MTLHPTPEAVSLRYQPSQTHLDEVAEAARLQEPHWDSLLNALEQLGTDVFLERQAKAQRILRDDGATYHINHEAPSELRTWGLDLVPSIISSQRWQGIAQGLTERAEVLNAVLKDLYGPQNLIRNKVIPPEAVFVHDGFLRACHGIQLPGEHQLILHSTDLMRTSQGEMCVLTDRTQAPSGAGYSLENRTVMSRVFPNIYRMAQVQRLANFFYRLRQTLYRLSPHQDKPRIAILTPGTSSDAYFEHAYIANYLGLNLVQSGDLTVRNGFVWMKTLDGLNRVDVILRRVEDDLCDPVELNGNSPFGVPGLLDVARQGHVAMANPLGAGLLENPIFLKYLPAMAKALLGRELQLPQVTTHWCGDAQDRAFVLANLDNLIVKSIHRNDAQPSVHAGQLSSEQRANLVARIKAQPMNYVAQPKLATSQTPTMINGALSPRPALLRTFTVAGDAGYEVLPGGLTRVGLEPTDYYQTHQQGSLSKDTWVIAETPEQSYEPIDIREALAKEADRISLPSRVLENLFWLGRNAERAEASLRMFRTVFMQLHGEMTISEVAKRRLLETVTAVTGTQPGFIDAPEELIQNPDAELIAVVLDAKRAGSVRSSLNAILNCADEARELLSSDTLRVVNDIRDALIDLDSAFQNGLASAPEEALDPLVSALMALSGLSHESMVRDVGWHFSEIGRRVERATLTATVIESLLVPVTSEIDQAVCIETLLLSLESLISYRRRYRARLGTQASLELIMLDATNPRSLMYQLESLKTHLANLPKPVETQHELTPRERALLESEACLKLPMLADFSQKSADQRPLLFEQLTKLKEQMEVLTIDISDTYFEHRETSQQLVSRGWETN